MFTTYSKKQCEVETTGKNDCKHHRDDRIGVERVIIYMKRIAKKNPEKCPYRIYKVTRYLKLRYFEF